MHVCMKSYDSPHYNRLRGHVHGDACEQETAYVKCDAHVDIPCGGVQLESPCYAEVMWTVHVDMYMDDHLLWAGMCTACVPM